MKPKIERDKTLPERVEFTLINGEKIVVSHSENRLSINSLSGMPLVVHPESSNAFSVLVGDSSELSKPFPLDDLFVEKADSDLPTHEEMTDFDFDDPSFDDFFL